MGWVRANVQYELTREPPPHGSLTESLFLRLWIRRTLTEIMQTKVLIAATGGDKETLTKAYEAYLSSLLPESDGTPKVAEKERFLLEKLEKVAGQAYALRPELPANKKPQGSFKRVYKTATGIDLSAYKSRRQRLDGALQRVGIPSSET